MTADTARVEELLDRARGLAADLDATRAALADTDEATQRVLGLRLDLAADDAGGVVAQLQAAAADLTRLAARPADACPAQWGCCPQHGNTLRSSGGGCWCSAPGCRRRWDHDRLALPCMEPAAFEVRGVGDDPGSWGRLCAGHTITARQQIDGVQVRALAGGQ